MEDRERHTEEVSFGLSTCKGNDVDLMETSQVVSNNPTS